MIKKLYLPLLMALVVALSSCSNKMGALSSDYFTTTPQVLEYGRLSFNLSTLPFQNRSYFNNCVLFEILFRELSVDSHRNFTLSSTQKSERKQSLSLL